MFLFKLRRDSKRIREANGLAASFGERYRTKGMLGPFREVESTGKNKSALRVTPLTKRHLVRTGETELIGGDGTTITANSKTVKQHVRRLRPEEEERLADLDEQIKRLQIVRRDVLRQAWSKGHVVTVKELTEAAEKADAAGDAKAGRLLD